MSPTTICRVSNFDPVCLVTQIWANIFLTLRPISDPTLDNHVMFVDRGTSLHTLAHIINLPETLSMEDLALQMVSVLVRA
jgi:hypothetical protein